MEQLSQEKMEDGYSLVKLKKEIGSDLVPSLADGISLVQMDTGTLGIAYVSMYNKAVDCFFKEEWIDCLSKCKALLDITWEYLYTGHWKDVHIVWRQAYTYVSYLKALAEFAVQCSNCCEDFHNVIRTCDMGLLMGAPALNNVLPKLASRIHKLHVNYMQKSGDFNENSDDDLEISTPACESTLLISHCSENSVSVLHSPPSIEHFSTNFMETNTPVIIKGCMDFWPALNTRPWSLNYFKQIAGYRLVPVEVGSKYTEDSWSQKLMTINEFIDLYVAKADSPTNEPGYLAQHQLFDQITELKNDITIPSYCGLGECDDVDINAWFGPTGTISPLHHDIKNNFLAQVVGRKYIRLYSTDYTSKLYPHSSHLLNNTSQVDVENPDLEKFPLFKDLPYLECVLSAGEMLYIPPMYWHYVRSLSTSFSVSFWWK